MIELPSVWKAALVLLFNWGLKPFLSRVHKLEMLASMSFPLSGKEERQKIVRFC